METLIINYGLPILGLIITGLAQLYIKINYNKYLEVKANLGLRGCDVARKILDKHDLRNVTVNQVSGQLTDHYDPSNKTVNLSSDIYNGTSIASISVASHECGHALQDKYGYKFMNIRSALVPVVNFSSKIGYIVVIIGLAAGLLKIAWIGIILLLSMLLFQIVTLPVEFNASRRALKEIEEEHIVTSSELSGAKKMLRSAALTYVAGMLSTLLQILRLALQIVGRRRN